ncbi:hypothetical protein [Amycolatopsis mediterranei]|uniref:Uncharacterized protein n=1 Tax=Amycolatopsis mediterranei (strain S699) TaxID=713604 RepID=A0A9R0U903_AMYMS|nr:hypothetical protein [Amycolatopsis mediterranei]AEK42284.1 hypothetical protein RAM_18990 [Amycolatopsis mediterranei S699]
MRRRIGDAPVLALAGRIMAAGSTGHHWTGTGKIMLSISGLAE